MNDHGIKPLIHGFEATQQEIKDVVARIRELREQSKNSLAGEKITEIAILARTNGQLTGFEQELSQQRIETQLRFHQKSWLRRARALIASAN